MISSFSHPSEFYFLEDQHLAVIHRDNTFDLYARTVDDFAPIGVYITAAFYDHEEDCMHLFTDLDHIQRCGETDGNISISNVTNDQSIDAMFSLDQQVYFKSGQFLWDRADESSIRPIIHHPIHNPRGIVSIDRCGWSEDESLRLLTQINATRNASNMMMSMNETAHPLDEKPLDYGTKTSLPVPNGLDTNNTHNITKENGVHEISSAKSGIVLCLWILVFAVSFLLIMMKETGFKSRKRSSGKRNNRISNRPATIEPMTVDSSVDSHQ